MPIIIFGADKWIARKRLPRFRRRLQGLGFTFALLVGFCHIQAQDNYEIQVYGAETVASGDTMVELHSNFTADGRRQIENGVLPTDHAFHETVEITHGFTPWFEVGAYLFTSARSTDGWQWVGDHIRPRVRVPEDWHWPVGLSFSAEAGYQRSSFSEDTWSLELRPIIDRQWGPWYAAFNPTLGRSLSGVNSGKGFEFAPNFKISRDVTSKVTLGLEYYGSLGAVTHFDTAAGQQHYLFPAVDLNLSKDWEINFGVGFGLSRSSDNLIIKLILGRRFH
jgi:Putative MetA-pathway of phenol degradation